MPGSSSDDRIALPPHVKEALSDESQLPDTITLGGRTYWPQGVAGAGFKAVVWKVRNENARLRAIKFAMYEDYIDRSFKSEVERAAQLEDFPELFPKLEDAALEEIPLANSEPFKCVYFIEEWVDGDTLDVFVDRCAEEVNQAFFLQYVKGITQALAVLEAHNLAHDDLHAGNVMLANPAAGSFTTGRSVRIVDLGSLKPANESIKPKADLDHVVDHLVALYNAIVYGGRTDRWGRRFLREAEGQLRQMAEPDPDRRLRDPKSIQDAFLAAERRAEHPALSDKRVAPTPFEFISSEHIADDRTFARLFARAPWIGRITDRDTCLLTGPRGCGKSTLFRWLSLKTQLAASEVDLARTRMSGIYISCSTELEGRFGWISTSALAERHADDLVHYFTLVLLRETVETILTMKRYEDATTSSAVPWSITDNVQEEILRFLIDALDADLVTLRGVSPLRQALDLLDRAKWRSQLDIRRGRGCEAPMPEAMVGDFTALLVELVPYFEQHRLTYLIDDFTERRLNRHVQLVLNRFFVLRRDTLLFKISSEKRGIRLTDAAGNPVELAREMEEVDIGRECISLSQGQHRQQLREFAAELLDNRLEEADWDGRVDTLLGQTDYGEYKTLARALRDGKGRSAYHGAECIADLCSGDVSTLLLVYRRIFERANVDAKSNGLISKAIQHETIKRVSSDQLEVVRTHVPAGPEMYRVVEKFGELVGNVLRKGAEIRQDANRSEPPTCPRIEVDGMAKAVESLDGDLNVLFEELVRRAVFIEMEPGLGRHGNVQTLRWQLRRVYLPAFRAALSKNMAISMDPSEFKQFLSRPDEGYRRVYGRIRKRADGAPAAEEGLF